MIVVFTHAPALAISAVLVSLNSTATFWFGVNLDVPIPMGGGRTVNVSVANILHLLQLAAKVSELLIIFSLSSIILDMYRGMLVTTGLPLGMITAGYRTGSLRYLTHSALLSAFRVHRRYLLFGLFIMLNTLLSILSGPACAILMVPTPSWYPVIGEYTTVNPPILFPAPVDILWPRVLNFSNDDLTIRLPCLIGSPSEVSLWCPGSAVTEVSKSLMSDRPDMAEANITVASQSAGSDIRRQIFAGHRPSSDDSSRSATFATTSSAVTAMVLQSYSDFVKANPINTISSATDFRIQTLQYEANYQPLVQVKCKSFDHDTVLAAARRNDTEYYPYWPMDGVECFDDARCAAWQNRSSLERLVDAKYWNDTIIATSSPFNTSFQWIETEGPLSAVFRMPYLAMSDFDSEGFSTTQGHNILACSLISRWIPSVTTIHLFQSSVLQSNVTDPTVFSSQTASSSSSSSSNESPSTGYAVQVDKSWADYLDYNMSIRANRSNPAYAKNLTVGYESAMNFLFQVVTACATTSNATDTQCDTSPKVPRGAAFVPAMERRLGMAMADGLSRVGAFDMSRSNDTNPATESTGALLDISADRIIFVPVTPAMFYLTAGYPHNFTVTPSLSNDTKSVTTVAAYTQDQRWQFKTNLTMAEWMDRFRSFQAYGLSAERYGYGTGKPSRTLTFSLAIISLYISVVAACGAVSLGYMLCRTLRSPRFETGTVVGWTDIQDLMTLVWRSRGPRGLENTGAGVKPFSTVWDQIATVRANDNDCLELVVSDGGLRRRLVRGKLYG